MELFPSGKSLISKEKAVQTDEKETTEEGMGKKSTADPIFFISMVGVDRFGIVDEHQHIFDVYTKLYDFLGSNVQVKSAQDLWSFYKGRNKGADKEKINIYELVEFFVHHYPNGHFVLDECPFIVNEGE